MQEGLGAGDDLIWGCAGRLGINFSELGTSRSFYD